MSGFPSLRRIQTPCSTPEASLLGLSQDERKEISNKIEARHSLWANSKNCDLSRENTLGQIERILYRNQTVKGDYFAALPFSDDPTLINPLQIKIIKPELVSTPFDAISRMEIQQRGNYIVDGVEFDQIGRHYLNRFACLLLEFLPAGTAELRESGVGVFPGVLGDAVKLFDWDIQPVIVVILKQEAVAVAVVNIDGM